MSKEMKTANADETQMNEEKQSKAALIEDQEFIELMELVAMAFPKAAIQERRSKLVAQAKKIPLKRIEEIISDNDFKRRCSRRFLSEQGRGVAYFTVRKAAKIMGDDLMREKSRSLDMETILAQGEKYPIGFLRHCDNLRDIEYRANFAERKADHAKRLLEAVYETTFDRHAGDEDMEVLIAEMSGAISLLDAVEKFFSTLGEF